MASTDNEKNPFTRPGFMISAAVVGILVAVGITLGVTSSQHPAPVETAAATGSPTNSPLSPQPSPSPSTATGKDSSASVCGLAGTAAPDATLSTAPAVDKWVYSDTIAYPTSSQYGPGKTAPEGYRYCFQHSPEGAVMAAGNVLTQTPNPETSRAWAEYFLSTNVPSRDQLLNSQSEVGSSGSDGSSESRMAVAGFRVLSYTGDTATVDLLLTVTSAAKATYVSAALALVWENGDWKWLPKNATNPMSVVAVPNAYGYIPWGV